MKQDWVTVCFVCCCLFFQTPGQGKWGHFMQSKRKYQNICTLVTFISVLISNNLFYFVYSGAYKPAGRCVFLTIHKLKVPNNYSNLQKKNKVRIKLTLHSSHSEFFKSYCTCLLKYVNSISHIFLSITFSFSALFL